LILSRSATPTPRLLAFQAPIEFLDAVEAFATDLHRAQSQAFLDVVDGSLVAMEYACQLPARRRPFANLGLELVLF
jgi:hypothetical protein